MLLGDLNIDVSPNLKSKTVLDYKNLLFSLGLQNMISKPTRITKNSETIIDHVLTNIPNQSIHSGILNCDVADHLPIYALCSLSPSRHISDTNLFYRSITTAKKGVYIDAFKNEISSLRFEEGCNPDLYLHSSSSSIQF